MKLLDQENKAQASSRPSAKYKRIALPASHGGWGFLLEPVLLGLLVAPSAAGVWLGLAALGAFLIQQPLKLVLSDAHKRRWYRRSGWAAGFSTLYGLVAMGAFGLALLTAQRPFWLPLIFAAPLAVVQLTFDVQNRGRQLAPELAGAAVLGATGPAIALAGGWLLAPALTLWLILAARALPSIIYVRAKLRLERGQVIDARPVWLAHLVGIALVSGAAFVKLAPWLAVAALLVLLARAATGLRPHRRPVAARMIGFQEMGYGLLTVTLTAVGYIFKLG